MGGSLDCEALPPWTEACPLPGWRPFAVQTLDRAEQIQPEAEGVLAVSEEGRRLRLITGNGAAAGDWRLDGIRSVDALLGRSGECWLWDGLAGKAWRFHLDEKPDSGVPLSPGVTVSLPPLARIVRAVYLDDRLILLDRGLGLLREWDRQGSEIRTVGRRLSYRAAEAGEGRIGFEFPGDLVRDGETLWVCDTGNRRLVSLNLGLEQTGAIPLADGPCRITGISPDFLTVMGPDGREVLVTKRYGPLGEWPPAEVGIDPATPALAADGSVWAIDESGSPLWRPPTVFPALGEALARPGLESVRLRFLLDHGETGKARQLAREVGSALLSEYWERNGDPEVAGAAADVAREVITGCRAGHERLALEIGRRAGEYLAIVRDLPGCAEPEAAQVEREVIGSALQGVVREFQRNLATWRRSAQMLTQAGAGGDGWDGLAVEWRQDCQRCREELARVLASDDLRGAGRPLLVYWLAAESLRAVQGRPLEKLPFTRNLVQVLSGFHSTLARLAIDLGLPEETYDRLMEEELARFPDRHWIFFERLNRWIARGRLDEAEAQLARLPGQDSENVHLCWSRLYAKKGDLTQAAAHLKRELELYPTRFELVPELIQLQVLPPIEVDELLAKLTERAKPGRGFWMNVARAKLATGGPHGAQECLDRELDSFPDSQLALLHKLSFLIGEKINKESMRDFLEDKINPMLSVFIAQKRPVRGFWLNVARAKVYIGDFSGALDSIEQEIKLFPENQYALPLKLSCLMHEKSEVERLKNFLETEIDGLLTKPVPEGKPVSGFWLNAAKARLALGETRNVEAFLDRELEFFPESKAALMHKLSFLMQNPNRKDELRCYIEHKIDPRIETLISQGNTVPGFWLNVARARLIVGEKRAAKESVDRELDYFPESKMALLFTQTYFKGDQ